MATPGTPFPRLGARIIDAILVAIVGLPLGLALAFDVVWLVAQAIVVFAYFVLLDVYLGTTAGKRLLGLRVVGPEGQPPSLGQAAIRESFTLLGAVPYAGPALALIAWIVIGVTINSSPTGRGKHDDLAGGTQVLRT